MDVYHKVLIKLYEVTGGKDTEIIDLKELVKNAGFLASYPDIFSQLSRQGWISETPRPDAVLITHWGVKEAKKSMSGDTGASSAGLETKKSANRLLAETKEFLILLEEFTSDTSKENFAQLEKKFKELDSSIGKLKENL